MILKFIHNKIFLNYNQINIFQMKKIKINLNGENFEILENTFLSQLISDLQLDPKKIAIEKDLEIIANIDYDKTILNENCQLEIVHFIGGG